MSTAGTDPRPFVELQDVEKRFGDHVVLKGINLEVAEHEVLCLIGASGSGKSTLLRCINGLEPIQQGEVIVDGRRVIQHDAALNLLREHVGIVFQSYNLFPHMTVLENIMLAPRKVLKLSKDEAHSRAEPLLTRIGMWEKRDAYPDKLSGGQQQRVAIVRALAMQPRLMLLDEITAALDPELVAEVLEIVRELAQGGMTMLIATHEMSFAREVAHRVCFLDAGVIAEAGPPEQIFTSPSNPRTAEFLRRVIAAGRM
jgi:polar amino acid transport system ATP-binding protein